MAAKATVKKAVETTAEVKEAAAEVKAAEKPAEKAAEVKAPEVKEAPAAKKPAAKKAAAPAAKKTPAKKATAAKKAETKASVYVEFAGKQIVAKDVLAAAEKDFAAKNKGVAIDTIDIYVKPEEGVAYYVVNGVGNDDYKVVL